MRKKEVGDSLEQLRVLLYSKESPLTAIAKSTDHVAIINAFARPNISRCIQILLKLGSPELRDKLYQELKGFIPILCVKGSGYHLCSKLLMVMPKSRQQEIAQVLISNPKTYYTKFGAKLWDAVIQKCGTLEMKVKMLSVIFFDKLIVGIPEQKRQTLQDLLDNVPTSVHGDQREVLISKMDKIVKKELLSSFLCHWLLAQITQMTHPFVNEYLLKSLKESIFEGCAELLTTREGVATLCRLCGFWEAKERKSFMATIKGVLALRRQTWRDYLLNEVDGVFVCRLIETTDDTKMISEELLASCFGVKFTKSGVLKLGDDAEANALDILKSRRAASYLVRLLCPSQSKTYLLHEDFLHLSAPSPATKKDPAMRRRDLRGRFFAPLWEALPSLAEADAEQLVPGDKPAQVQHRRMISLINSAITSQEEDDDDSEQESETSNAGEPIVIAESDDAQEAASDDSDSNADENEAAQDVVDSNDEEPSTDDEGA
eukprot:Protomagalhaensia_sp_Gyna_25__844@NODE_1406_length_1866_cov_61_095785_g1133_i0_p1_GENE_NODE_1406_length_1866_cov_61_095785_g1133_i0NODE_1406_length_1866_cov_61_095785_g1133_i0_p1_ORF_typecomplete_len574_score129_98CPL/PF08144_11/2_3e03CPL/PF08144_11/0_11SDA1/PF05285_12/0_9_NODE_1406_length_1866_cov_61_095785_g1133_i01451608